MIFSYNPTIILVAYYKKLILFPERLYASLNAPACRFDYILTIISGA